MQGGFGQGVAKYNKMTETNMKGKQYWSSG